MYLSLYWGCPCNLSASRILNRIKPFGTQATVWHTHTHICYNKHGCDPVVGLTCDSNEPSEILVENENYKKKIHRKIVHGKLVSIIPKINPAIIYWPLEIMSFKTAQTIQNRQDHSFVYLCRMIRFHSIVSLFAVCVRVLFYFCCFVFVHRFN